jgi:magnesium-transporting ATPase (P-type)
VPGLDCCLAGTQVDSNTQIDQVGPLYNNVHDVQSSDIRVLELLSYQYSILPSAMVGFSTKSWALPSSILPRSKRVSHATDTELGLSTLSPADFGRGLVANDWRESPVLRSASCETVLQAYASMSPEAALHRLQVTDAGLTTGEASSRLAEKGANLLSVKKPPSWWQLLLSIIPNPFNILLGLLAIISVATPPPAWSTFILLIIMILISCAVRFWQEYRSTVAAIRLQAKVSTDVRVRRHIDGLKSEEVVVDEKILVPGDILMVDPGDAVPADCLILEASSLQVSQSRFAHRMFATIFPLTQI